MQDLDWWSGLTAMLASENRAAMPVGPSIAPHTLASIAPKAKSVIWLFMIGGASHMESFDPKPALNRYAGKTFTETPFGDVLKSPYLANERVVAFDPNNGFVRTEVYPLQVGYRQWGSSGLEISNCFHI